jgi:cytochrome c
MVEKLSDKVIVGGMGVWGEHAMSAHPNISKADAKAMVNYILSLGDAKASNAIATSGTLGSIVFERRIRGSCDLFR